MRSQSGDWSEAIRSARDHREFVGPADEYDVNAAMQFSLLTYLGLRESHTLLDIGCGSLRGGRLFIVYLLPARYFGIEPEQWLVECGIREEIGTDLIELKSPSFSYNRDFACTVFDRKFDYILAQGVFVHAPEWQIRECISEAAKCMKPTSILAATYMQGNENYSGSEWVYPETTTYTPIRMAEIASAAGLSCIPIAWPHPRGANWILLSSSENEKRMGHLTEGAHRRDLREKLYRLQGRLTESEQTLSQLIRHPYVKTGVEIRRFLGRLLGLK